MRRIEKDEFRRRVVEGLSLSGCDYSHITDMEGLFSQCTDLRVVENLDLSNVVIARDMFNGCVNLEKVSLVKTGNVEDMTYMFSHCENLKSVSLDNTSKVVTMEGTFSRCKKLTDLYLSNTSNVENMSFMFYLVDKAIRGNVKEWNFGHVLNMWEMMNFRCMTGTFDIFDLLEKAYDMKLIDLYQYNALKTTSDKMSSRRKIIMYLWERMYGPNTRLPKDSIYG